MKAWGNAIFLVHADQDADKACQPAMLPSSIPETILKREDDVAVYDTAPDEHTDF